MADLLTGEAREKALQALIDDLQKVKDILVGVQARDLRGSGQQGELERGFKILFDIAWGRYGRVLQSIKDEARSQRDNAI